MAQALGPDKSARGSRFRLRRPGPGRGRGPGRGPGGGRGRGQRLAQLRTAYSMTAKADPRIGWILAGIGLGILLVFLLFGLALGHPYYWTFVGVFPALVAMAFVFGRRAERAAFSQVEGQLGAAASVLQTLRKGWIVTPAVAVTRNQDVVHRAVGRPGVVLVAEGAQSRLAGLLAQEKKKLSRIVPDVPVYDFQAGNADGQVPLRKLQRELLKLPRNLRPTQVDEVERRLKALGTLNLPIPKGPLPRNARMPRSPRAPRS